MVKHLFLYLLQLAKEDLSELQEDLKDIESLKLELADFFCEDPGSFKLEECFNVLNTFCSRFKKAISVSVDIFLVFTGIDMKYLNELILTLKIYVCKKYFHLKNNLPSYNNKMQLYDILSLYGCTILCKYLPYVYNQIMWMIVILVCMEAISFCVSTLVFQMFSL